LPTKQPLTTIRRSCQAATGRGSDGGSVRLSWLREPGVWWVGERRRNRRLDWMAVRMAGEIRAPPFSSTGQQGAACRGIWQIFAGAAWVAPGVERWTLCTPRVRACSDSRGVGVGVGRASIQTRRGRQQKEVGTQDSGHSGGCVVRLCRCARGGNDESPGEWRKVKGGTELQKMR
jgi:hypothetical protein